MIDDAAPRTPAPPAPATAAPTPGQAVPASPAPAPADPQVAAERAIEAAVDRLEASRASTLDDQLAAAEAVHATLGEHLSGSGGSAPAPR